MWEDAAGAGGRAPSLIQIDLCPSGAHYRLLETIRQYASDKLAAERAEAESVGERRACCFLILAEKTASQLRGPHAGAVLDTVEADHVNLRAALAWLGGRGAGDAQLRMAGSLARYRQRSLALHRALAEVRGVAECRTLLGGRGRSALRTAAFDRTRRPSPPASARPPWPRRMPPAPAVWLSGRSPPLALAEGVAPVAPGHELPAA